MLPDEHVCLKESEWREIRDFMVGTAEFRIYLEKLLVEIKKSADYTRSVILAVTLCVLIPSIIFWVSTGEMKRQIEVNTGRLDTIEQQDRLAQIVRSTNVAKIEGLENRVKVVEQNQEPSRFKSRVESVMK